MAQSAARPPIDTDPSRFLLIESQGHWSGPNAERFLRDALALALDGRAVGVFLVQDGVFAAVEGVSPVIAELAAAGARIYADDFSIGQRALAASQLSGQITVTDMDGIATMLLDGAVRAVWH